MSGSQGAAYSDGDRRASGHVANETPLHEGNEAAEEEGGRYSPRATLEVVLAPGLQARVVTKSEARLVLLAKSFSQALIRLLRCNRLQQGIIPQRGMLAGPPLTWPILSPCLAFCSSASSIPPRMASGCVRRKIADLEGNVRAREPLSPKKASQRVAQYLTRQTKFGVLQTCAQL